MTSRACHDYASPLLNHSLLHSFTHAAAAAATCKFSNGSGVRVFLSIVDVLKESISIPKHSPKTFSLITLTLIFPLSIAILLHSLYAHPLLLQLHSDPIAADWTNLIALQFLCLVVLFVFSLFSTAAVVFTVASLYSSKPVSFPSTIAAIPRVFKRLCATFIWVSISMSAYNFVFFSLLAILILVLNTQVALFTVTLVGLFLMFLMVHAYISSLWHLASVLSVVETVYGLAAMKKSYLAAMKKSYRLLKGKAGMGFVLVFCYLALCGVITVVFGSVVVRRKDVYGLTRRIFVGGFLFGLPVILNLVGLLVQSVFYYVCKSYHHQGIDKSALYEQLGGYLGEYVPLKSSIQMEDLDA